MKFAVFFCDCLHFKIKIIYTLLLHSIRICYRNKYTCIHLLVKGLILHGINQLYVWIMDVGGKWTRNMLVSSSSFIIHRRLEQPGISPEKILCIQINSNDIIQIVNNNSYQSLDTKNQQQLQTGASSANTQLHT